MTIQQVRGGSSPKFKAKEKPKEKGKGRIGRDIDPEQLEEMLDKVTKRHNLLKKRLAKNKNSQHRDKITLQYMLSQSIEMLELCNTTFITSGGRGTYGVIALNNNIRELQNDLRALEDNSNQIDFLNERVIKPMITVISQQNISFVMAIKSEINKRVKPDQAILIIDKMNDLLRQQATLFDDCCQKATDQIDNYFNEGS